MAAEAMDGESGRERARRRGDERRTRGERRERVAPSVATSACSLCVSSSLALSPSRLSRAPSCGTERGDRGARASRLSSPRTNFYPTLQEASDPRAKLLRHASMGDGPPPQQQPAAAPQSHDDADATDRISFLQQASQDPDHFFLPSLHYSYLFSYCCQLIKQLPRFDFAVESRATQGLES